MIYSLHCTGSAVGERGWHGSSWRPVAQPETVMVPSVPEAIEDRAARMPTTW